VHLGDATLFRFKMSFWKARRTEVLRAVNGKTFTPHDLTAEFGYTYSGALCRLQRLRKLGLADIVSKGNWALTEQGKEFLRREDAKKKKKRVRKTSHRGKTD